MKENIYDYAVLLGVDGAGTFFRDAKTPNIDRIFANGAVSYHVHTAEPTISGECWGSMLLGVTPEMHRLTNSIVSNRRYDVNSIFPSVFRKIHENDPTASLASFCNWNPINYGIIESDLGVHEETGSDSEITDHVIAYLEKGAPKFLFMQFDEVDGAGHHYGYGKPGHIAQIETTDGYIGRIYDTYEKLGILDRTLFIITADHGGTPGGSHGGTTDAEKYVMYAAVGKTVQHGEIGDMEIRDNTAIIMHAFGYKCAETWTARIPDGVFEGIAGEKRPVYEIKQSAAHRIHTSVPTPSVETIPCDKLMAYLPFDKDCEDKCGNETEQHGKVYYVDGYHGNGIRLDDGYITINGISVGDSSFSVAFWMKAGDIAGDPAIFGNKDWKHGSDAGFVMTIEGTGIQWNLANGSHKMETALSLPLDYRDGWVHITVVVDREANEVRFAYDFGEFITEQIPEEIRKISYDTSLSFNVGQDGTGSYHDHLSCVLDDFMVISKALTKDDMKEFAKYYDVAE